MHLHHYLLPFEGNRNREFGPRVMSFTLVDEFLRINMSRFAREILTGFVCCSASERGGQHINDAVELLPESYVTTPSIARPTRRRTAADEPQRAHPQFELQFARRRSHNAAPARRNDVDS